MPSVLITACSLLTLLILGCGTTRDPAHYLEHYRCAEPSIEQFTVCSKAGCRQLSTLSYSGTEWQSIVQIFSPEALTADDERQRLRIAIATIEDIIGQKNGTHVDHPRNRREGDNHGAQLDCIAEATNTTVALTLLESAWATSLPPSGLPATPRLHARSPPAQHRHPA